MPAQPTRYSTPGRTPSRRILLTTAPSDLRTTSTLTLAARVLRRTQLNRARPPLPKTCFFEETLTLRSAIGRPLVVSPEASEPSEPSGVAVPPEARVSALSATAAAWPASSTGAASPIAALWAPAAGARRSTAPVAAPAEYQLIRPTTVLSFGLTPAGLADGLAPKEQRYGSIRFAPTAGAAIWFPRSPGSVPW